MPVKWTRQNISSETFESAAVFDVDGDGVLDIVSGGFWHKGPDFRRKFLIVSNQMRYQDYYDDFSAIAMDVDGDGKLDIITGGWWGENLRWRKNPGIVPGPWASVTWREQIFAEGIGHVETTRAWDIDGDGQLEVVPNTPNAPLCAYKLVSRGTFTRHELFPRGLGHGLGFGDIDNDGKGEFITPAGILKAPANPMSGHWSLLPGPDIGSDASIPVLIVDLNGDGINELIVGNSHSYGLSWWQRSASGWDKHPIDPYVSQYHDLHWADIDNDGKSELIAGKRYMAHCGNDPGEFDDVGIYYFKWTGEGFSKQVICHGPPGAGKGCGIQFALADLSRTGRLDLIAPGKDGLTVFFNQGV